MNIGNAPPTCLSSNFAVKSTFLDDLYKYAAVSIDLATYDWASCSNVKYIKKIAAFTEIKNPNPPFLYNLNLTVYFDPTNLQCTPTTDIPLLLPNPVIIKAPSTQNTTVIWDFSNDPIPFNLSTTACLGFKIQCIMDNGNLCSDLKFSTCDG